MMATSADAGNFVFGLGADNILDDGTDGTAAIALEYHSDPFYVRGRLDVGWGTAVQVNDANDLFLGVGLSAEYTLSQSWFFEASLMPGYYGPGSNGTDLGGNFHFRTLVGFGYNLTEKDAISIAIDHRSNASIEGRNPGTEALMIRYRKRF